ncbi:MAG: metallophosphoesterase family protein [Thermoanaerobaculia bacterium]
MIRLAILSDIHGNVPALDAVLDDIAAQHVDEVLVGGDLVGRGPQGSTVVKRIRRLGFESIGGNHEDYLLAFRRGEIPADWRTTEEWAAARWMAAELDVEDAAYVEALPFSLARPGLRLVHGTPKSNRQGIGPWTEDAALRRQLGRVEESLLVCAHTHRPLIRELEDGMIVNVGSVGLPFNRDQRAQYAIFERGGDGWGVEPRQVAYDLREILRIYETSGFLAAGGVTARLLRLELEHATPLLVPFIEWTRATGVDASIRRLDDFFAVFQPGQSIRDFFRDLRSASATKDDRRMR